jgi:hypothetical protein
MRTSFLALAVLVSIAAHADGKAELELARAKWAGLSMDSYSFTYLGADDNIVPYPCIPYAVRNVVRKGKPRRSMVLDGSAKCQKGGSVPAYWHVPRTVEALFSQIERLQSFSSDDVQLQVRYDANSGVPIFMRAYKPHITDSDEGFDVRDIKLGR